MMVTACDPEYTNLMQIPSLKKLERALHIRGTIEKLQSELATLFTTLGDAIAHTPPRPPRTKPKPPFADEAGGARSKRSKKKGSKRKGRSRKSKAAAAEKSRIRSVLTGGETETAPVATEPKAKRKKTRRMKGKKRKT
jgi:hypothetical protein